MSEVYHAVQLPLFSTTKYCPDCKNHLPLESFSQKGTRCKACVKVRHQAYYSRNHDKCTEQQRQYEAEHREQALERTRQWRKRNPESRKEEGRKYYARHAEKENQRGARYRDLHREENRARGRKYYREHPEQFKPAYHNRRARKLQNGGTYTAQEWRTLCGRYRFTCLCCGKQEPHIKLTPDHVIPLTKGGSNDIDNIQPLCLPCNMRKRQKTTDYRLAKREE